jgi:hypothetical protein
MNDTFNFRRMGLLIRKHWLENRRRYLIGIAAYTGLIFAMYYIGFRTTHLSRTDKWDDYRNDLQFPLYAVSLYIGGIIYAGLMFTDYSRKESGVFNLLVPASALEKAIVMILFGIVFYWLMFNLSFLIVDASVLPTSKMFGQLRIFNPFISTKGDAFEMAGIHIGYVFLQTLFVLGSIYFRRFAFFKTAIVAAALVMFFMGTILKVDRNSNGPSQSNLVSVWDKDWVGGLDSRNYDTIVVTKASLSPFERTLFYGAGVAVLLGLWTTITMRIREKEI